MERKVTLILSLSCFRRHEGVHPPRVKSLFDCIIVQAIILNQKNEVNLISVDQSKGMFGKEGEENRGKGNRNILKCNTEDIYPFV